MELLYQPGEEYLYNPPPTTPLHSSDSSICEGPPGGTVFRFDIPNLTDHHPSPPYYSPGYTNYVPLTPCTPVTPNADIPDSPFDVFTTYTQFSDYDVCSPHGLYNANNGSEPLLHPTNPSTYASSTSPCLMSPSSSVSCSLSSSPSLPSCTQTSYLPPPPHTTPPFPTPTSHFTTPQFSSCGEPTSSLYTDPVIRRYEPVPPPPPGAGLQNMMPSLHTNYSIENGFQAATGVGGTSFVLDNKLILEGEEAYKREDYEGVLKILGSHSYDRSNHEQLQHLWLAAIYGRESVMKRKKLTAVDRYRLRKRNPFPASIWEGEKTIYCLRKSARDELTSFFDQNSYPTPNEKRRLANSCGLTYVQISNWFKNKRMRVKESNKHK